MKIFLIGFMGSGKSTVGKYVARHVDFGFMDTDKLIEAAEGTSVEEIFNTKGEDYFRQAEQKVLKEICETEGDFIISCGGGMPCFFDNMEIMNQFGTTLYIDLSSARLTDRIRHSKNPRPLLKNLKEDLQTHIHKMLLQRAKFYFMAKIIVPEKQTNKKGVLEIVLKLKQ